MAVARAQHAVRELTEVLRGKGVNVRFAIHPVAGRLPGPHERAARRGERAVRHRPRDGRDQPRLPDDRRRDRDRRERHREPGAPRTIRPARSPACRCSQVWKAKLVVVNKRVARGRLRRHRQPAVLQAEHADAVRRREGRDRESRRSIESVGSSVRAAMRRALFVVVVVVVAACGHHHLEQVDAGSGSAGPGADAACTSGLACFQVDCSPKGLPPTSLSGTVYAPNGTLPLYGVNVYVPATRSGRAADRRDVRQVQRRPARRRARADHDRRGRALHAGERAGDVERAARDPGRQVAPPARAPDRRRVSGHAGRRRSTRRCRRAASTRRRHAIDTNGAPKVDLPYIAITTGSVRRARVPRPASSASIRRRSRTTPAAATSSCSRTRRGAGHGEGAKRSRRAGPAARAPRSATRRRCGRRRRASKKLRHRDVVVRGRPVRGDEAADRDAGGPRLRRHGRPRVHVALAQHLDRRRGRRTRRTGCRTGRRSRRSTSTRPRTRTTRPRRSTRRATRRACRSRRGCVNVGASTTRDEVPISEARYTLASNDPAKSERWAYIDPSLPATNGHTSVQDLQFTTPLDQPPEQRCGKVVFSDMHVSSGSTSSSAVPYPGGCSTDRPDAAGEGARVHLLRHRVAASACSSSRARPAAVRAGRRAATRRAQQRPRCPPKQRAAARGRGRAHRGVTAAGAPTSDERPVGVSRNGSATTCTSSSYTTYPARSARSSAVG